MSGHRKTSKNKAKLQYPYGGMRRYHILKQQEVIYKEPSKHKNAFVEMEEK